MTRGRPPARHSQAHAATYAFPDAYAGQSTALRDTMVNLIIQSPQDCHTGTMLPFTQIEGTTVEWDELRFDVRLMQRVPYEGVSRMQTSIKRRHRDRIVRRGLGMMIGAFCSQPFALCTSLTLLVCLQSRTFTQRPRVRSTSSNSFCPFAIVFKRHVRMQIFKPVSCCWQ